MEKVTFEIKDFELVQGLNEEFASVSINPSFRYCKFVLTDDLPNANKCRIPEDEFDNLIRSGLNAPIKMAAGRIEKGHENALPIGAISSLVKSGNKVLGLAALWEAERPEDVALIKKQYDDGNPVNLSWEVYYDKAELEEDNVKALRDTFLRATTIVGLPAYQGRTPILQVASTEENVDLEQALAKIAELEASLETSKAEIEQKNQELDSVRAEKEELASFKAGIESELAKAEKLQSIQNKFKEAGIEKEDQYFVDNAEKLLGMGEAEFDFMLQELVAFASQIKQSNSSVVIPNITNVDKLSPKEIARRLRSSK